jgi:hypothetical protein
MSYTVLSFSKFYAHRIESHHSCTFPIIYKRLQHGQEHQKLLTLIEEVLHATEALHHSHAACNTLGDGYNAQFVVH